MLYALLSVFLSCMQFVRSVTAPIERLSSFIAIMRMFVLIDATLWYSKDELFVMWQGCSTNIMNRICFISLSPMPSLRRYVTSLLLVKLHWMKEIRRHFICEMLKIFAAAESLQLRLKVAIWHERHAKDPACV